MRLLLVEDDPMIAGRLLDGLARMQYAVDWVRGGLAAKHKLASSKHDLILIDSGLSGENAILMLDRLRRAGNTASVLIISACNEMTVRVHALDAGADDVLVKPFEFDELFARIRMLLRRRANRASSLVIIGPLRVNLDIPEVRFEGVPVQLQAMEFQLLCALLHQPGKVLSRHQLEERMYGPQAEIRSNTVDVLVHRLRRRFGAGFITTVRGVGYKVTTGS